MVPMVLLLVALPGTADANGRVQEFQRQIAGPYEVAFGTIPDPPVVGTLHLTVRITETASDMLVLNADVTVTAVGPVGPDLGPAELGPLKAMNTPSNPAFYDLATSVDRLGEWMFTVAVASEFGEGVAEFPLEVREQGFLGGVITLLAGLALLIIVGLSLVMYLQQRGRRKATG